MSYNYLGHESLIGHSETGTLAGVHSLDKARLKGKLLPEDVVFYCPFNDSIGTDPASITCYTSTAGSTEYATHTDLWLELNDTDGAGGEIIATPGTNPMSYTTCYNSGENAAGDGVSTNTTKGNALFEDICYGVTTNISIEYCFYLGTDSQQGAAWGRVFDWSSWYESGDGFVLEFHGGGGTADDSMAWYNNYGLSSSRVGDNQSSMDQSIWYRCLHIWDLADGTSAIFVENQNGAGGNAISSLIREQHSSTVNAAFEQTHDGNGNLTFGARPNRTTDRYNGGVNELIVRVNTSNMTTITDSNPYVVLTDPLL